MSELLAEPAEVLVWPTKGTTHLQKLTKYMTFWLESVREILRYVNIKRDDMHLVINKIAAGIQPSALKRAVLEELAKGRLDEIPPSKTGKWKHEHEQDVVAMGHLVIRQAHCLDNVEHIASKLRPGIDFRSIRARAEPNRRSDKRKLPVNPATEAQDDERAAKRKSPDIESPSHGKSTVLLPTAGESNPSPNDIDLLDSDSGDEAISAKTIAEIVGHMTTSKREATLEIL